jgi:hypothetical protein
MRSPGILVPSLFRQGHAKHSVDRSPAKVFGIGEQVPTDAHDLGSCTCL